MKILVIGAGATVAEAKSLNIGQDQLPPLMRNFARTLWQNFNPHPYLCRYLAYRGYLVLNDNDARLLFYDLEREGRENIEKFMQFCWDHREMSYLWSKNMAVRGEPRNFGTHLPCDFINAGRIPIPGDIWNNMIYHGFSLSEKL